MAEGGNGKARYVVAVPAPPEGRPDAAGTYSYEREALDPIGAEIVEVPSASDADFVAGAKDANAIMARGRRISAEIIAGLDKVVVIGCGSVGTDTVDVDAATAAGIPVTNVPDVFVEEVADHTLALLLAAVPPPQAHEMPQLIGRGPLDARDAPYLQRGAAPLYGRHDRASISFGNIARAVARRCKPLRPPRASRFDPVRERTGR